ncbi:MAG: family 43 glycosylhydrolase [Lachnospiraceae bacterium]|nr:family 43 glycosylhydrolase [Lachnospiraceae bacterium]
MALFRRLSSGIGCGDSIPFYHDGVYHLFFLSVPENTVRYPERVRNTWQHVISRNLVDWEELPPVLLPGDGTELDKDGCWTGSVIYANGKYHIFYTGYHIDSEFPQTICHAISEDCITFTKDPNSPLIVPDTRYYESIDWRDAYIFYNEEEGEYWMLIAARKNEGPSNRRGVVVLYTSTDLAHFEHKGILYEPWHTNCPECPEMYKMGDYWYLVYSRFSERAQTIYRVSKSPYGPWRTPKFDGIDNRRFYAAKSLLDDKGRRIYFAWTPERENQSDDDLWQTGGDFGIPHEVIPMADGNLKVVMPEEIQEYFRRKKLSFTFESKLGQIKAYGDKALEVSSLGTLSYGFFHVEQENLMLECNIKVSDCADYFGLTINSDEDIDNGYLLAFNRAAQAVSLNKLPAPLDPFWATLSGKPIIPAEVDGPRVCEKPFPFRDGDIINVKCVLTDTLIEIFVGDLVAFSYRTYRKLPYRIGIFAQDCNVEYHNIHFSYCD